MYRAMLIAIGVCAASPAPAVDWYVGDYERCAGESTTVAIVQCVGGLVSEWDGRLNDAYWEAMSRMDGRRATKLRNAQRAWIAYRNANCDWYRAGEGSIASIEANTCVYALTRDRTIELETYIGE